MNAPEKATEIKLAISAIFALLTSLWGWVGWAVVVWISCVILDYISGSAAARANGEWSSEEAREGLWHKCGEIFAVLVAALCDIALVDMRYANDATARAASAEIGRAHV